MADPECRHQCRSSGWPEHIRQHPTDCSRSYVKLVDKCSHVVFKVRHDHGLFQRTIRLSGVFFSTSSYTADFLHWNDVKWFDGTDGFWTHFLEVTHRLIDERGHPSLRRLEGITPTPGLHGAHWKELMVGNVHPIFAIIQDENEGWDEGEDDEDDEDDEEDEEDEEEDDRDAFLAIATPGLKTVEWVGSISVTKHLRSMPAPQFG
ncbi:hypothetical protein CERZMDRAFT_93258 [Cercospora zeae-maydis SCOH1-5]|uniref:Uncharacterized protein n=1 Tax=Cercospora zeae-maydis SCOH1-5 TaxID=717836 RepID=A0A6A6FUQ2_9PEZI|nr:hypothetical protein CERZMDRAFT_93258 [Cercospora zeae-maydis SCOH1-5]